MVKLVVFDLDGTLIDTAPDLIAAMNVSLAAEGLGALDVSAARDLIGAGAKALIQRGLTVHGRTVSAERLDALLAIFLDHYGRNIAKGSVPFPGMIEALEALRAEGWRFAVCTNKLEAYARLLLDELNLSHWFDAVTGGDSFAFRKPDGRHILETVARAGGAGRVVMIGDSSADVDAARSASVPVVGVTFGYTTVPMADLKPDVLIDSFAELPGAVRGLAGEPGAPVQSPTS